MRRTSFAIFGTLCGLAACSDAGSPSDLGPSDPCAPYASASTAGCRSSLHYAEGPVLPSARDHHATAIAETAEGAFLYVSGGSDYDRIFKDVHVARIRADGALEAFTEATALPGARAGHGVVVHGGRMYLVGGRANAFLSSAISAPIRADGKLGEWELEPAMPAARFHLVTVASETHLFAIGGVKSEDGSLPYLATRDVFAAPFLPDGHLGPWQTLAELPEPRSHHAAVIHDGHLYIAGGLIESTADGAPYARTVLSAALRPDGTLGSFAVVGSTPDAPAALAASVAEGGLLVVGGLTEDYEYAARVRRAQLLPDGKLGLFEELEPLPEGRSHVHHTPYYKGRMYSGGGSLANEVVTDALWVAQFSPVGALAGATLQAERLPLERAPVRRTARRCTACSRPKLGVPQ